MILNLHSLAFNTITESGGGNPAWGTEMGQGDGYRFHFEDADEFITALVYNSVPSPKDRIYCPLGKGGNQADDYEFVLGSLFKKVYVNGIKVNGKFLLLVVKKLVGANHVGRRTLKYNPRITLDGINYNEPCFAEMAKVLGVSPEGSWFVSEINVRNQDELHFTAFILDKENIFHFTDSSDRSKKLQEKILASAQAKDSNKYKTYFESINFDHPLQQIFFGAPGTGKSFRINEMCAQFENYRTTFHPDTDYASFVGSYKPITKKVPVYGIQGTPLLDAEKEQIYEDRIVYRYIFQSFLKAYIAAWKEQQNENPKPVFLIIEEINRGNCAQIFGDIFQLLDRNEAGYSDYPIVADDDLAQELSKVLGKLSIEKADAINELYLGGQDVVSMVKNGSHLLLPNNLYIWSTMNTSDQSLFPIDSAFKRRWEWKYIKIQDAQKDYRISFSNGNEYDWWQFVSAINSQIEGGEIQQEDKKLGYFFAKAKNGIISAETFVSKVLFYLYNDVFKDFGLEEEFFQDEHGSTMTFTSYFNERGEVCENRVEKFITNLHLDPINSVDVIENDNTLE